MNHDDLIARLRAMSLMLHDDLSMGDEAADAIAALVGAMAFCEKHQPNGGHRANCVVCSGMALSVALSKISYICGPANEMECGPYDVNYDESVVVSQVAALVAENARLESVLTRQKIAYDNERAIDEATIARLTAERDAVVADAERYRWLRSNCECMPGDKSDAAIDAAIAAAQEKP